MVALPCLAMCWAGSSKGKRGKEHVSSAAVECATPRYNTSIYLEHSVAGLAFHHCGFFLAELRDTNATWMELDLGMCNFLFLRQIRQPGNILAIRQASGNLDKAWQLGKIPVIRKNSGNLVK